VLVRWPDGTRTALKDAPAAQLLVVSSSIRNEVASLPTIGAATRFITWAPVPADHMIGMRPMKAAVTVIIFGRTRFTAPWTIASCRSARVPSRPRPPGLPAYRELSMTI
jgi:hypothetical protein